jgi:hypothetical protein
MAFDDRTACLFRSTAIYEILRGAGWSGADPAEVAQARELADSGAISFAACDCRDWAVIRGAAYDAGRRLGAGIAPMFVCPTSCAYIPSDAYAPDPALPESRKPHDYSGPGGVTTACPPPAPEPLSFWKPLLLGAGVAAVALAAKTVFVKNPDDDDHELIRERVRWAQLSNRELYETFRAAKANLYRDRTGETAEILRAARWEGRRRRLSWAG